MMNKADQSWLENRVSAAVDDDFYLDRDEEKRIKEEGTARGILIKDIDLIIKSALDEVGAVSERVLLNELDRLLHQFTDNDQELDPKEERDALDKVMRLSSGKKAGLDPRVAEDYVHSFCKSNGITRTTDKGKFELLFTSKGVGVAIICILILVGSYMFLFAGKHSNDASTGANAVTQTNLTDVEKAEIDDLLKRTAMFIDQGQYTDPPEKSAKANLDAIHKLDPTGQYQADKVKNLEEVVVEHYLALAEKSYSKGDIQSVTKWLGRAKLFSRSTESIIDAERKYGLLQREN